MVTVLESDPCDFTFEEKNAYYLHHLPYVPRLRIEFHRDPSHDKCARAWRTLSLAKISNSQKRTTFNPLATMIINGYQ